MRRGHANLLCVHPILTDGFKKPRIGEGEILFRFLLEGIEMKLWDTSEKFGKKTKKKKKKKKIGWKKQKGKKNWILLDYACHPCAGAMLIFSVSFQF